MKAWRVFPLFFYGYSSDARLVTATRAIFSGSCLRILSVACILQTSYIHQVLLKPMPYNFPTTPSGHPKDHEFSHVSLLFGTALKRQKHQNNTEAIKQPPSMDMEEVTKVHYRKPTQTIHYLFFEKTLKITQNHHTSLASSFIQPKKCDPQFHLIPGWDPLPPAMDSSLRDQLHDVETILWSDGTGSPWVGWLFSIQKFS